MEEFHNVAVFIDYENIYKTLLPEHKNLLRMGFFEKLRDWCEVNNQRIVKIVSYCNYDNNDLYESYHQSKLQEYGVETIHTSNRGKNYADMQLAIDVLNQMYLNSNIDEFIIISNDKDMTPLINTIKANKRKVALITANECYDSLLNYIPDKLYKIDDIINGRDNVACKIEEDEKSIIELFDKYCQDKVNEAIASATALKHPEMEYTINNYVKRFHIMKYEMVNIFAKKIKEEQIIVYNYTYKSNRYKAFITRKALDSALENNKINSADIFKTFDSDGWLAEIYNSFVH